MKLQTEEDMSIQHLSIMVPNPYLQRKKNNLSKSKALIKMKSLNKSKKNNISIKKVLKQGKKDMLCNQFKKKLKRVIVPSQTPSSKFLSMANLEPSNTWERFLKFLSDTDGLEISYTWTVVWALLNSLQTIAVVFIASIMLAFAETKINVFFKTLLYVSWVLHFIDIILNSTIQRMQNGRKLKSLKQLCKAYLKQDLKLDIIYFFSLAALPLSIHISVDLMIQVIMFVKMFNSISRFDKFQHLFLKNISMQKYYHVIKVVFLNFMIAHIIAIILLLMSQITQDNWMIKHNLKHAQWSQKYIWSYYWGVTIMLTVGFGDFAASNKQQALLLVFIQTFSCILLAYNINTVGIILNQIRIKQRQRNKKVKIFMKMSEEDKIPNSLSNEIISFIDQSYQIKDKFQYQQYENIVESLPALIKSQVKKQANKQIFYSIPFINLLSRKTMMSLAEKIHRKIAHPEEIIHKKGQIYNFTILKKGKIAFCCRKKSVLDGMEIQYLQSEGIENSKLLSLKFLKSQICNYDVKSLDYSVIYELTFPQFIQTIKDKSFDYQLLCQMRDKDDCYLNDFQIYNCPNCPEQKHNQFDCPKLHYMPLKRHIINKSMNQQNKKINKRRFNRKKKIMIRVLHYALIVQCQYEVFAEKSLEDSVKILKGGSSKCIKSYIKKNCQKRSKDTDSFSQKKILTKIHGCSLEIQNNNNCDDLIFGDNKAYQGFWSVQCDSCNNFGHYFRQSNPQNLNKNSLTDNDDRNLKKVDSYKVIIQSHITPL